MNPSDVPGIDVVKAKLSEIDSGLVVESIDYVGGILSVIAMYRNTPRSAFSVASALDPRAR